MLYIPVISRLLIFYCLFSIRLGYRQRLIIFLWSLERRFFEFFHPNYWISNRLVRLYDSWGKLKLINFTFLLENKHFINLIISSKSILWFSLCFVLRNSISICVLYFISLSLKSIILQITYIVLLWLSLRH